MKNDRFRFLSLVAIIVIALAIPATVYILRVQNLDLRFQAFGSEEPTNVVISDINSDSFRVSWVTEKRVQGGILLSSEDRSPVTEQEDSSYHSIIASNLQSNKLYNFGILSNGTEYKNKGVNYEVKTSGIQANTDNNFFIYGQVFSVDGLSFQQGGVIVLEFEKNNIRSQKISSLLNEAGGYQINLNRLKNENLNVTFIYETKLNVIMTVYTTDNIENPVSKKYQIDLSSSRQLPNFYLGDTSVDVIPGIDG